MKNLLLYWTLLLLCLLPWIFFPPGHAQELLLFPFSIPLLALLSLSLVYYSSWAGEFPCITWPLAWRRTFDIILQKIIWIFFFIVVLVISRLRFLECRILLPSFGQGRSICLEGIEIALALFLFALLIGKTKRPPTCHFIVTDFNAVFYRIK